MYKKTKFTVSILGLISLLLIPFFSIAEVTMEDFHIIQQQSGDEHVQPSMGHFLNFGEKKTVDDLFSRVVKKPMYSDEMQFREDDWPMYRYDARRGAATPHELPEKLHLNWVLEMPEPQKAWVQQIDDFDKLHFDLSYEPVVAGGLIYVPSMVTDKLTAYDIDSGESVWSYYTDGPIRLAPVVWNGRIFIPSDDGHIYCLSADEGELLWKFQGGPTNRKVLGNERLISMWSVRGGPVIKDGILYFAAGVWPHEGVFIYALNAISGGKEWVNSGTGNRMDLHPHGGAYAFGGVAPQGSFVVSGDKLIVPGGRTTPAVFNRHSGELLYFRYQQPGKGGGGYRVYADEDVYFNPSVTINHMYSLEDGRHIGELDAHIVARGRAIGVVNQRPFIQLLKAGEEEIPLKGDIVSGLEKLHLLAGSRLYGSGKNGMIVGIDVDLNLEGTSDGELSTNLTWTERVDGDVFRMIAAQNHLFVVTTKGNIYCFGPQQQEPVVHEYRADIIWSESDEWTVRAEELLERSGLTDGYALMFGVGSGRLLEELLRQSNLHIVAFDTDESRVRQMREKFDKAGLYGKRVAVHEGDALTYRLPDYIASLIVSEDPEAAGLNACESFAEALFRPLRPYGGTIYLPLANRNWYRFFTADRQREFVESAKKAELENAVISENSDHVLIRRPGSLPGSDVWSHQYSDAANTTYSADDRVRAPLGITWFGGPGNEKVLPRHLSGPVPQVVEGKLVILGVNHISARCVYTGREIWAVKLPLVGKNFTSLEHEVEQQARQAPVYFPNQPGANTIGSPYVTTTDGVYIIHEDRCLMLDLDTGVQLAEFELPGREELPNEITDKTMDEIKKSYATQIADIDNERWGHISTSGDYLIVAAYPHFFDDGRPGLTDNWNATSSEFLVVMDRFSGEVRWAYQSRYGFRHNAIAVSDDRIFVMDNLSSEIQTRLARRGIEPGIVPRINAFDIHSGELLWTYKDHVFGTWLSYSQEHDVLLQAGRRGGKRDLADEPNDELLMLRGEDGVELWRRYETHDGPVAMHMDQQRIIAGHGQRSLDLLTGDIYQVRNPVNGFQETWRYNRTYGCGTQNVSKHLITFRSGAAGYTDLLNDSGTGNLAGFRAGCTNNLIVADGVLNAPDYTRSCSCSYQQQTSLAFVHMPDVEKWTYNMYSDPEPGTIKQVGVNFGAPGSRLFDGTMWINYPLFESERLFSRWDEDQRLPVPWIPFEMNHGMNHGDLEWFTGHSLEIEEENNGYPWVAASGVVGVSHIRFEGLFNDDSNPSGNAVYTVRLQFSEPVEIAVGERVFDVLVQGDAVLQELDIIKKVGGSHRMFVAEISDVKPDTNGSITLELLQTPDSKQPPMLSGVDIRLQEERSGLSGR